MVLKKSQICVLQKIQKLSKKEYYQSQFLIARTDSAKTWKLMNTLLPGRTKATSTPPNLTHLLSGECKQNPTDIANILNDFK